MRSAVVLGCLGALAVAGMAIAQSSGVPGNMATSGSARASSSSPAGSRLTLFSERNFRGRSVLVIRAERDLRNMGFNDTVQSLRTTGTWTLCRNVDFRPPCRTVRSSQASVNPQLQNVLSAHPGR